jgi:hypothetical protein
VPTLGIVGCSAGGLERLRSGLVLPALDRGWTVAVTLTPTAARWLRHDGELARIEDATGLPVRSAARLPHETSPHPSADCFVAAPASANTVAKLALGIADNQALTTLCEVIGGGNVPVVVFPRVNAAHARQPAWSGHLAALLSAGVRLVYGEDVWPLYEPRSGHPDRDVPWGRILTEADAAMSS